MCHLHYCLTVVPIGAGRARLLMAHMSVLFCSVQVRFAFNVLLSAIYGFQVFYAYFLMMVFMTFNGYIIIAIIVGFFIGHLVVKCIKEPGIEPFQAETPCH